MDPQAEAKRLRDEETKWQREKPSQCHFVSSSLRLSITSATGFTLIEMLTTVAALIILMGLAVSLAREVRRRSADVVTRDLLAELDAAMARYQSANGQSVPPVQPLMRPGMPANPDLAERALLLSARQNSQQYVAALQWMGGMSDQLFGKLPRTMYDDTTLRDPWGNPIVFMADMHPAVGMSSDQRPWFFVSAGPDGHYLTRDDNLYSYESR